MSKAPRLLFALVVALISAAVGVLVIGAGSSGDVERRTQEFHHLVGGLGFGPVVDLTQCEFSFDPRLCPACSNDCGPIAGGMFFCPQHACSIFEY
jgi:hypothetical protein